MCLNFTYTFRHAKAIINNIYSPRDPQIDIVENKWWLGFVFIKHQNALKVCLENNGRTFLFCIEHCDSIYWETVTACTMITKYNTNLDGFWGTHHTNVHMTDKESNRNGEMTHWKQTTLSASVCVKLEYPCNSITNSDKFIRRNKKAFIAKLNCDAFAWYSCGESEEYSHKKLQFIRVCT